MPEDIMTAQRAEYDELDLEGGFTELETEKYLIFLSGGIYYGVDTKYVKEMLTQWETSITWLPMLPPHIRGVINLRGGIVPILDMEGILIGILVDEVDQTLDIEKKAILPVPYQSGVESQKMVTGMCSLPESGKTLMVLDCTQLMNGH